MTPWFNRYRGRAGADAGLMRIKGSKRALAMALDGNGAGAGSIPNWRMHAWRNPPERLLYRSDTGRGDKLPELWQSGKAGDNVAVFSGGGRPDRGVHHAGNADYCGNVSLYTRRGRRYLSHAGDRYRRNVGEREDAMTFHFRQTDRDVFC